MNPKIDEILVINLPHRLDRLRQISRELKKFAIKFNIYPAIHNINGEIGLYETMIKLFNEKRGKNLLIFEDDARFLCNPVPVFNSCIDQLPQSWDLLYLGSNIRKPVTRYSENLLHLQRVLATHAVAYSKAGIEAILDQPRIIPYDYLLADKIIPRGNSFASYPMIATQRAGLSDIKRFSIDWHPLMEERFNQAILNL